MQYKELESVAPLCTTARLLGKAAHHTVSPSFSLQAPQATCIPGEYSLLTRMHKPSVPPLCPSPPHLDIAS